MSCEQCSQEYLSLQQFFPCLVKLLLFSVLCFAFTFYLAQPLLQYKLWRCPGSFLVLLLDTWRKCLYNPPRGLSLMWQLLDAGSSQCPWFQKLLIFFSAGHRAKVPPGELPSSSTHPTPN